MSRKIHFDISYSIKDDVWRICEGDIQLYFKKAPFHVFSTNLLFLKHFETCNPNIIIDAGAYHGTVGLYLAKKYPDAEVLLLEPDPDSYDTLVRNIGLNALVNAKAIKKGLWNADGVIHFQQGKELSSSVAREESTGTMSIKTISPDTLLNNCSGMRIFCKMNIEGAELEALPACYNLWQHNSMSLAVATDHFINGEYTYKQIEAFCRAHEMDFATEHVGIYKTTYIKSRGKDN